MQVCVLVCVCERVKRKFFKVGWESNRTSLGWCPERKKGAGVKREIGMWVDGNKRKCERGDKKIFFSEFLKNHQNNCTGEDSE
jgi:hypothetical protein